MVAQVEQSGPAEKAGLLVGDVIVEIDNKRVESIDELHRLLSADAVGKEARLTVLRLEKKVTVSVIPRELAGD